jgi:hypothetical protein
MGETWGVDFGDGLGVLRGLAGGVQWRFGASFDLRRSPLGRADPVAGAHDCGPERSLRTAPSSSSYAFGSLVS